MGFEVKVKWLPDNTKFKNGRQLLEEVAGDTILSTPRIQPKPYNLNEKLI